jgi:FtsX-like permease family protein
MRGVPAAVRVLSLHRLAFGITALTVLVTAASTAASAAFAAEAATVANQQALTANPGSPILVNSPQAVGPAQSAALLHTIAASAPGLPMTFTSASHSDPLNLSRGLGGPQAQTELLALQGLRQHARLASGAWPGATVAGVVPACLPAPTAHALGLAVGEELTTRDGSTGRDVRVRLTCTFSQRQPGSSFWRLDPLAGGTVSRESGFTSYSPLVTSWPAAGWPVATAGESWLAVPDFAAMTAGNLTGLSQSVNGFLNQISNSNNSDLQVFTNLPALLSAQAVALEVARSQLLIGQLILLVIAGATLTVVVQLLATQRAGEPGLLMARGATRRQLARRGASEAALLATPAAVIGPLAGVAIVPLVSRLHLAGTGALRLPAGSPRAAWLAGIAVAAGCALIIALPWLRQPPSPIRQRAAKGRQRTVRAALSSGADFALVLLAAGAAWQLAHYAAPVSTGVSGAIGVDPVLVAAPVLALAAGTLIMLRLLPLLIRLTERLAARGRGITVPAAAWMIGRRALRQAGPALLAVLAVATCVISLAEVTSWQRSVRDQAAFTVGADARVTLPPSAPLSLGQVGDVTGARGVVTATPVIQSTAQLVNGSAATVLGIDGRQAAQIVPLRSDLAITPVHDPLGPIAASAPAGERLPGRPAAVQVLARLTGSGISGATLSVELTDAAGVGYDLPAGPLPANGSPRRLEVSISPGNADYPLSLTGFQLNYVMPGTGPNRPAELDVQSVSADPAGRAGLPLPAVWPAGQTPATNVSAPGLTPTPGLPGGPPRITALAPAGKGAVLKFLTGAGQSPSGFGLGAAYGTITFATRTAPVLPAIATRTLLSAAGLRLGSLLQVTIQGLPVSLRLAGEVAHFPAADGSAGGVILNQAALQGVLEDSGSLPMPVTEWWLRDSGRLALGPLPAGSTVLTEAGVLNSLRDEPLSVAPLLALLGAAVLALLLTGLGFLVSVAAPRERGRDLAVLDALGATPGQLTRLLCLEQAMLSVPAAAGGLALGLLLARLIVPAVTLTSGASQPVPSVLIQVPMLPVLLITAAVAALPVAAAGISVLRGTATVARLRAEEET